MFIERGYISGLVMQPRALDKCVVFNNEKAAVSIITQTLIISVMNSSYIKHYFRRTTLCPRTVIRSEVLQSFSRAQAPVNRTVDSLSTNRLTYIPVVPNF